MDPELGGRGGGGYHSNNETTSPSANTGTVSVRFDPVYVRSLPGTLKCAQMVLNLLGFICVAVAKRASSSTGNWFSFVAMGGFWITLLLFLAFLFHIIEKFNQLPWLLIEWVYCALWAFFYFTAATATASQGGYDSAMAAAAFFGYCAMLVYGFDAYLKYISWRAGDIPQQNDSPKINNSPPTNQQQRGAY